MERISKNEKNGKIWKNGLTTRKKNGSVVVTTQILGGKRIGNTLRDEKRAHRRIF